MSSTQLSRTPQQTQAIATFSRTERDPAAITAMLKQAASQYHLVSPATACGALPEGFCVAFSSVLVDVERDTYDTKGGGKRGLHRHVLDRISAALAVSWDPRASRRLDDGRDPHYCQYTAVGNYKHFDGSLVTCVGTKEMDLRDGSPQIAGKSEKEISMQRTHILAHAETKARMRAIAAIGVKRSYTADELKKPFVVARLMFTGSSPDPELRRAFALMQARAHLFGRQYDAGPALPEAPLPRLPAPPVGAAQAHDDEEDPPSDADASSDEHRAVSDAASPEAPAAAPETRSGLTIPGGHSRGTPIEDAAEKDLQYWATRIEAGLTDGTSRSPERDRALASGMRAELARRDREG